MVIKLKNKNGYYMLMEISELKPQVRVVDKPLSYTAYTHTGKAVDNPVSHTEYTYTGKNEDLFGLNILIYEEL